MSGHVADALLAALAGRYRIEHELGRGGMATVYRVEDLKHGRYLALKVLNPDLAAAVGRQRFLREIAIAAQLTHPNILPLHDSGEAGGQLYYLMPYVEGESLQDRLTRERQLPIEDALRIGRDVASALSYAHARGIVHRDIKPGNILLSGSAAVVADFGIARAISQSVSTEALTSGGLSVGTPSYMSPEQATGSTTLDARSDIYSLGCVLYEMLTGDPPFTGSTGQAILARHIVDPAPPLRTVRPTVPDALERAVLKSLEKVPADRFASAERFGETLEQVRRGRVSSAQPAVALNRRRLLVAAIVILATAVILWFAPKAQAPVAALAEAAGVDSLRYVVLPAERSGVVDLPIDPTQLLQDALNRWSGISVVDQFQVRDAMERAGRSPLSSEAARSVALALGAGKYLRSSVVRVRDSLRLDAVLYDATQSTARRQIGEASVGLPLDLTLADSAITAVVDRLLFGPGRNKRPAGGGTTSVPARLAYQRGQEAIEQWNLARADSEFSKATENDPDYAQASLWLALARAWSGQRAPTWRSAAELAGAGRARLTARDQLVSDAVLAFARGDVAVACHTWQELAKLGPYDFVAWYGWADCQRRDNAVLHAQGSPSGWHFRSSYHSALRAYQRAFQLVPTIHRAFRGDAYASIRALLNTSESQIRLGWAQTPDSAAFGAAASWSGDTLAFYPVPFAALAKGRPVETETTTEAVQHQRDRFREIATSWVTALPRDPAALEALALALEMLGDRTALDTLHRARQLATDDAERRRLADTEVWMLVRTSVPGRIDGLRNAAQLADSILSTVASPTATDVERFAALSALTGRAHHAAQLSRLASLERQATVPPPFAGAALPLRVYAAFGGPPDSLRALESRVVKAIDEQVRPSARPASRLEWLAYAATMAFPDYVFASIPRLRGKGDYLLDLQAGWLSGDSASTRDSLQALHLRRASLRASELTLDALYPEARLLAAIGDARGAADWLDPTLSALPLGGGTPISDVPRAAALVRSMALRAKLARELGDTRGARQWAGAVVVLWSDADAFLQPLVSDMRQLAQ